MGKFNNINNLNDLKNIQAKMKQSYVRRGQDISGAVKAKAAAPFSLLTRKKQTRPNATKVGGGIVKPVVEYVAMGVVGLLLPRKMGFLAKWIVSFAAKKVVRSVIQKKLK